MALNSLEAIAGIIPPSHAHFARQHWRFRFGWRLLSRLGAIMGKSEVQKTGGGVKHKELYTTIGNASLL